MISVYDMTALNSILSPLKLTLSLLLSAASLRYALHQGVM